MRNQFAFGGHIESLDRSGVHSSLKLGLTVERKDTLGGAEADLAEYEIPGRDGTFFIPKKRRKNVTVLYETYMKAPSKRELPQYVGDIKRWLMASPGEYRRLEDSYDPDHYRWAVYRGGFNAEEILRGYTRQEIVFSCLPYRYRKAGDQEIALRPGYPVFLNNDTGFDALPVIRIERSTGTDSGITISVAYEDGSQATTQISQAAGDSIHGVVDSRRSLFQMANENGVVRYAEINFFPVLKPGKNSVMVYGANVTGAGIRPCWREL